MKKTKQIFLLILVIAVSVTVTAQTHSLELISNVAAKELTNYLNKIPIGQEKMFGFNNRGEFSEASIGEPYEMLTLNNDFFNDKFIVRDKDYIMSTGNWRIPIMVNKQNRALLTISKVNNEWHVVKIGAKGLAEELEKFNTNHPLIIKSYILRVFQLKSDFVLTSKEIIYPLTSAKRSFLIEDGENIKYSLYDLLILVKSKIVIN
jgi:hypothetical protein|tara:strand:- start:1328 stop:1942 length:615 start_codon:yes stop_codon:yes gene_type:complete